MTEQQIGVLSAAGAFLFWGLMPIYWQPLSPLDPIEVTLHRIFWGALFAWIMIFLRPRSRRPAQLFPRGRSLAMLLVAGVLVCINWLTFVIAVTSGRTFDASLGYYINPLVSVVLGMIFFGERLDRLQWVAVAFAASGVLYLTIALGEVPWASFVLASTFGTYGLIKKRSAQRSVHSLAVELTGVAPVALIFIVIGVAGVGGTRATFLAGDTSLFINGLLIGGGLMTIIPLILFGMGAQRIRLSDVGFLQYIAPTTQFLVALLIFGEPLERGRLICFIGVWIGLLFYSTSVWRSSRRNARVAARPGPR